MTKSFYCPCCGIGNISVFKSDKNKYPIECNSCYKSNNFIRNFVSSKTRIYNKLRSYIKKNIDYKTRFAIIDFIRNGKGYSDPTDMFDSIELPYNFQQYSDKFYSSIGAIALMDHVLNYNKPYTGIKGIY